MLAVAFEVRDYDEAEANQRRLMNQEQTGFELQWITSGFFSEIRILLITGHGHFGDWPRQCMQ